MTEREPKDYHLARRAYEAFYDEQPQVWFENLDHEFKMKWVRAARAVLQDARIYKKHAPKFPHRGPREPTAPKDLNTRHAEALANAPRRPDGRIDYEAIDNEAARKRIRRAYKYMWKRRKI